jgi:protocatechuate 3,4-dioxygenase beta subunit
MHGSMQVRQAMATFHVNNLTTPCGFVQFVHAFTLLRFIQSIAMKKLLITHCLLFVVLCYSCAQNLKTKGRVGGRCEGCEAIYECPTSFDKLTDTVYLPDWNDDSAGIAINGTVYKADGKTPAAGVILYVYHTDQTGIYPRRGNEKGWGKRHGYIRGWMKTNENGGYKFFTRRPAPYPGGSDPAHIHIIIKEPGMNEYWIDEYLFDDDPLLTQERRKKLEDRGGSGILVIPPYFADKLLKKAERNIYLGKNIPDYPVAIKK